MRAPSIDSISPGEAAGAARLTASSELMKNYATGRPVDAERRIAVLQDARGEPLIFSISTDGRFFVIHRDESAETGWRRHDLSSSLAGLTASVFEVSQGASGQITLALAVHPSGDPDDSRLYVTRPIDPAKIDWATFGEGWVARPRAGEKLRITQILMGTSDDGQGPPLTIVAATGRKEASHYRVNADVADVSFVWKDYPLPENADEILDLAIGTVFGDRGVYALYRVGADQTLEFSSLPDPKFNGKVSRYAFRLPGRAASIAVTAGDGDSSDLYVAGEGVHVFRGSGERPAVIAAPDVLSRVRRLIVRRDERHVAVWTVGAGEALHYIHGRAGASDAWDAPLLLARGIAQAAAFRNRARQTNALFIVEPDHTLHYRSQDPSTSLWHTAPIPLPDTGRTLAFDCYTTQIGLHDAEDRPIVGAELRITASEWAYVTINGGARVVDPEHPVAVRTDALGSVTIIHRVSSLATPVFQVTSERLAGVVDVNPAAEIARRLAEIRSGDDLLRARNADGSQLAPRATPGQRDAAAKAIGQMVGLLDRTPDVRARGGSSMTIASLRAVGSSAAARSFAAEDEAPAVWGMAFGEAAPAYLEGDAALANVISSSGTEALAFSWDAAVASGSDVEAGSLLDMLWRGLEKAAGFVMDGLTLVVTIGKRILRAIVETAEQIYQFVSWALKETLGLDLDAIVSWLGFVFSWGDILKTHEVIVNVANQSLLYAKANVTGLARPIDAFFDNIRAAIERIGELPEGYRTTSLLAEQRRRSADRPPAVDLLSSPTGNFGAYHLLHSVRDVAEKLVPVPRQAIDALESFVNRLLLPAVNNLRGTADRLLADLQEAVEAGTLTPEQLLHRLGKNTILGLLDTLRGVVVGAVEMLGDLIQIIHDLANQEVEIPFLTSFYRNVVTNGSRMSVLDGLVLLMSIPATAFYKLAAGRAPFEGEAGRLATMGHEELFAVLRGEAPARPSMLAAGDAAAGSSPTAKVYSHVGGAFCSLASILNAALSLAGALTEGKDSELVDKIPPITTKGFWLRKEILQIGLSLIQIAGSFPTGTLTPSLCIEYGLWGESFLALFKDLIALFVPEKTMGSKIIGGIEVVEAAGKLIAHLAIFILDVLDTSDEEYNPGDSVFMFCQNVLEGVGGGCLGAARLIVTPETKLAVGAVGGALALIGALLNGARTTIAITTGITHYNF